MPLKESSKNILSFFVLALLITIAYSNSCDVPFVFDDTVNISGNQYVHIDELSWQSIKDVATKSINGNRWIPNVSFAIQYYFSGLDVKYYHLLNILIHIATAFALYFLILITLQTPQLNNKYPNAPAIAFLAAALWSVHPIQISAVTYIVQRMISLMALFYLLAMIFYILARRPGVRRALKYCYFLTSILAFIGALLCKENSAMLPVMIIAYEIWFLRDIRENSGGIRWVVSGGIIACLLLFAVSWFWLGDSPLDTLMTGYELRYFNLEQRLLTEIRIVIFYISLLFFPFPSRLNVSHQFELSTSLIAPSQTFLSLIVILGLLSMAYILFRRHRVLSYAVVFYFANLVIESSIVPLELVYEHRLYLPSTFIFPALIISARPYYTRYVNVSRIVTVSVVVILVFFTIERNKVWSSEVSLWTDTITKSPALMRGYNGLGLAYIKENRLRKAEEILLHGLEVCKRRKVSRKSQAWKNEMAYVYTNLGNLYRKKGDEPKSLYYYELAESYAPMIRKINLNLAISYLKAKKYQEADKLFQKIAVSNFESVEFLCNWGQNKFYLGQVDISIILLKRAIKMNPEHAESHYNLGIAYAGKGDDVRARQEMMLGMQLHNK